MAWHLSSKNHCRSLPGEISLHILPTFGQQALKVSLGQRRSIIGHPGQRAIVYSTNEDVKDQSRGATLYEMQETHGKTHVQIQLQSADTTSATGTSTGEIDVKPRTETKNAERQVSSFVRSTATTFAPRASTATRNPAFKGSVLYTVFGAQAWISLLVGGLLSFNIIFPSDKPSIARLLGMWSIWMFTIPALRARECTSDEKEVLNLLFVLVPLLNVALPFIWKSFSFIFITDCAALAAIYYWKIGWPDRQT